MPNLTYKEKMAIQFIRNKSVGLQPTSQRAIAEKFGLSAMYVNTVINGKQHGPKADEWRKKFAAYAGMSE
ncbi:XRE family transcriptional regulator [Limosilactobacillus pontis]|uniref:XRE family transcriptional regulator n=1 Tax=Limosilactobacillus pontis TaxID=35787 RepID=A0ABT7UV97_9LACO|nr:XRE family transcriptional regulator [Limosilactobacillus pontis]MDM8265623.1 XRE family transcriptional regulator [Limosilactobacillus pontis]